MGQFERERDSESIGERNWVGLREREREIEYEKLSQIERERPSRKLSPFDSVWLFETDLQRYYELVWLNWWLSFNEDRFTEIETENPYIDWIGDGVLMKVMEVLR